MKLFFLIIFLILFTVNISFSDKKHPKVITKKFLIKTSDYIIKKKYKYKIINLIDNNSKTSFVFINKQNMWIEIDFLNRKKYIKKVGIISGYTKNKNLFYKNNRIKLLSIKLNNSINEYKIYLNDTTDIQFFDIQKRISKLKFTIKDVFKGNKYNDTCISEIQIFENEEKDLLNNFNYYIESTGGEYPQYQICNLLKNNIFNPEKAGYYDGIVKIVPSKNFNKFAFETSEVGNQGLLIYDLNKKEYYRLLKKYWVQEVKWLNNKLLKATIYNLKEKPKRIKVNIK